MEVKLATLLLACAAAACTSALHDTTPDAPSGGATRALAVAAPARAAGVVRVHCVDVGQEYAALFDFPNGGVLRDAGWKSNVLQHTIPPSRPTIDARVGQKGKTFIDSRITQAVYATGWDGTVVLEAGADGAFTVVRPRTDLVNINTASAAELERLPGIGAVKAAAIGAATALATLGAAG